MISFSDAIVDPRTVVVHLTDASLAHRAMMRSLGLDAAALGALKDNLALFETHAFDVLFRGVASRHGSL